MNVKRKPLQIFLIEHLLYPIIGFICLALIYKYGIKLTAIYSDLPPNQSGAIFGLVMIVITTVAFYILIPFSCYRLWLSSNKYLVGLKRLISKIYAGVLFMALAYGGVMSLLGLPYIVEAFNSIYNT